VVVGGAVVAVGSNFSPPHLLTTVRFTCCRRARCADHFELALPFLLDPDRTTYRGFGFGRASPARVWGWRNAKRYVRLLLEGNQILNRSTQQHDQLEDTRQLGGDVVIAKGRVQWIYRSTGPEDRPVPTAVVDAVIRAS